MTKAVEIFLLVIPAEAGIQLFAIPPEELIPGLTRAFLALALRVSFTVRARSGTRSRRDDKRAAE
jgi:hypothetical protein